MSPEQFVYWLQGFSELNSQPPTAEQWEAIKAHLQLVFTKVTPPVQPSPFFKDYNQFPWNQPPSSAPVWIAPDTSRQFFADPDTVRYCTTGDMIC